MVGHWPSKCEALSGNNPFKYDLTIFKIQSQFSDIQNP
jgi:hypothetical protein